MVAVGTYGNFYGPAAAPRPGTRWRGGSRASIDFRASCHGPSFSSIDDIRRSRALRKVVAVNLKKQPGGGVADDVQLREATQRDRRLINRQLSLYEPDYVICCGRSVTDLLFGAEPFGVYPLNNFEWKSTGRGVWYKTVGRTPHIAYSHPQARMPGNLLYYGLIDAVAELASS